LPPIADCRTSGQNGAKPPLTHSFCQYVVSHEQPLRVPDAHLHPVLKSNLAIPDLGVVAYLGVPLRLPGGEIIGAVAAIDGEPREWTEEERMTLEAIADIITEKISTFTADLNWRNMFEQLREGFVIAEVVRDAENRIVDWRYLQVNNAWGDLVGIDASLAVGRTVREVFPHIEEEWIHAFANVVETGKAVKFTRQVGSLDRWYDGYAQHLDRDTFVVLFMEVTERMIAQQALSAAQTFSNQRQTALIEIGDALRQTTEPDDIVRIIAGTLGRTTGASRVVDAKAETVEVTSDWCAPGQTSIVGVHRFRDYGSYIDDLKSGKVVLIRDVLVDPRTRDNADALRTHGIRVLINVPIIEKDRFVGLMMVHYDHLHPFPKAELDFVRAVADRTQSALSHARAQAEQRLLDMEISHRLKNSMAMVQAIAVQTLRGDDISDRRMAFTGRLEALSNAHDMLTARTWQSASILAVVDSAIAPHLADGRFVIEGPDFELTAKQSLSLSLALHELATNATKYGSLSTAKGMVSVCWFFDLSANGERTFTFEWRETGGPQVAAPDRKGFGSRLITRVLPADFAGSVEIEYPPTGVVCRLTSPASGVGPGGWAEPA
jgi:two-component sensor histidine kinase/PAS domain-containing protein